MNSINMTAEANTSLISNNSTGIPSPALSPKSTHNELVKLVTTANQKPLNITEYSNPSKGGMKKRCRTIMTPAQSRILRRVLDHTAFPSTEVREQLARMLGMKPRTVQIWFQNQRQKSRQQPGSIGSPVPSDDSASDTSLSPTNSPDFSSVMKIDSPVEQATNSPVQNNLPQGILNPSQIKFHGSVFKSLPGYNFGTGNGGNTAASIASKRSTGQFTVPGFIHPPPQPQLIPMLNGLVSSPSFNAGGSSPASVSSPNFNGSGGSPLPLDLLASAVSNFRPHGYSYLPPNRLAPLGSSSQRTPSPPVTNNASNEKLPSLKALAQIALDMEAVSSAPTNVRRPW